MSLGSLSAFLSDGLIAAIDYDDKLEEKWKEHSFDQILDASGCCIVPGLVDAHTHPVWAGDRVEEFAMKVMLGENIKLGLGPSASTNT